MNQLEAGDICDVITSEQSEMNNNDIICSYAHVPHITTIESKVILNLFGLIYISVSNTLLLLKLCRLSYQLDVDAQAV